MEGHGPGLDAVAAEGMDEPVALVLPAVELDAEFDRAVGRTQHLVDIETQGIEVAQYGRNGGFAHSDSADLRGFDHRDANAQAAEALQKRRRRHPSGRAAAEDDDRGDGPRSSSSVHAARPSGSCDDARRGLCSCPAAGYCRALVPRPGGLLSAAGAA